MTKSQAPHEVYAPFMERFGFDRVGIVCVVAVAVSISAWVVIRGTRASEGLLRRPLRVGIVAWPGYAGGLVANNGLRPSKDSDFWKKYGLLVEFVLVDDEVVLWRELARGGEDGGLDVIWSTVDSIAHINRALRGAGGKNIAPRVFMQVDWSRGADAIVASAAVKRIEDLRDRKIAVPNAASLWLLEYSLSRSSLAESDRAMIRRALRIQTRGSEQARDLFVDTKVDAAVLWEPHVTEALAQRSGAHRLVDTSAATRLIADVMVADEAFIRRHPKAIAAFTAGWLLDGTTKALNDPMAVVKVLRDEPGFSVLDEETVHNLVGKVKLATLDDNIEMFGLSGGERVFDRIFNGANRLWSKEYNALPLSAARVRDSSFLNELYITHVEQSLPGCGSEFMTSTLPIAFLPGKAELTAEARRILDDEDIGMQLRAYSDARFCVDADANDESDPGRAAALSRARSHAVIQYLVTHYNRRRSQFTSASDPPDPEERTTQCIRLKIESPPPAVEFTTSANTRSRR